MDITKTIADLKQEPGFTENVGMILAHVGVVRGFSRNTRQKVAGMTVTPDLATIEAIRCELQARPGIFRILVQAESGAFVPGDTLLYLLVAGDIREHVKPVLSELLDRIKAEAVAKQEAFTDSREV